MELAIFWLPANLRYLLTSMLTTHTVPVPLITNMIIIMVLIISFIQRHF